MNRSGRNKKQQPKKMTKKQEIKKKSNQKKSLVDIFEQISSIITKNTVQSIDGLKKGIQKISLDEQKRLKSKIRVNVNFNNANNNQQAKQALSTPKKTLPDLKHTKQKLAELQKYRQRTMSKRSHHQQQRKANSSLQKNKEQEMKAERIIQINKRKIQLMDRMKKLDAQLYEVKKQHSPLSLSKTQQQLYQSKINKSYFRNLTNSKLNRNTQSESVVEQHSKAISVLQRINNEKIKKQQKIAEQFRKKQQRQIKKLEQIQRIKNTELENRQNRNLEEAVLMRSKYSKKSRSNHEELIGASGLGKLKLNSQKYESLLKNQSQDNFNEANLMPMTMINKKNLQSKTNRDLNQDEFFNNDENRRKSLLTDQAQDEDQYLKREVQKINQSQSGQDNLNQNQFEQDLQKQQGQELVNINQIQKDLINEERSKIENNISENLSLIN